MRKLPAQKEQLISVQEEEESTSSIKSEDSDPHIKAPPLPPTDRARSRVVQQRQSTYSSDELSSLKQLLGLN